MTFQEIVTVVIGLDDDLKDELITLLQNSKSNGNVSANGVHDWKSVASQYESEAALREAIQKERGTPGSSFRIALILPGEGPEDWSENLDNYLYGIGDDDTR